MRYKISSSDLVWEVVTSLRDDLSLPWNAYPCIPWERAREKDGYGFAWLDGQNRRVHRLAWEISHGVKIGDDIKICHHCDNPPCFRPIHLFDGTTADNIHDCVKKGRNRKNQGSTNGEAKLTVDQVLEIRSRFDRGERPYVIAIDYPQMCRASIENVARRRSWKSV